MDKNVALYEEYCEYKENFDWLEYFKGIWTVIFRILTFPLRFLWRVFVINGIVYMIRYYIPSLAMMMGAVCHGSHPKDLIAFDHEIVAYECMLKHLRTIYTIHVFLCDIRYLFRPTSYKFFVRDIINQNLCEMLNSMVDRITELEKMNDLTPTKKKRILREFDKYENGLLDMLCKNLLRPELYQNNNGELYLR